MRGWKISKPYQLEESDLATPVSTGALSKVKITKALLTLSDVLHFMGETDGENVVLGSSGIGIVSETETNLFGLEKGNRVYIEPIRECGVCANCKACDYSNCDQLKIAGDNDNGFLSNFTLVDSGKLFLLPESVRDLDALFINHISLAISVVDKLGIKKGDYVAIVGANNFGNILAQLLIYYQAVPIIVTNNDEDYQIAKNSGIYYVLSQEDNWQKEVLQITGARMCKSVVYISDCDIPVTKAFNLAAYSACVAYTGMSYKSSPISFAQAVRKQLQILCINNGYGNTAASINLIANKAINLSHLKLDNTTYENAPETLKNMSEMLEKQDKVYETVVDLV